MKRIITTGLALLLAGGLAQAADFKVLADRKADFGAFKTFKFDKVTITRSSGAKVKQANKDKLRDVVASQLVKEGLTQAGDGAPADVVVSVIAGTDAKLQPSETQGVPYFDGTWKILPKERPSGEPDAPAEAPMYNQATLRIDIRNAKSGDVVWRALMSDLVQLPVSEQKVQSVVSKAFEQYPPPPAE
ncbi:MAG TPA: DUF4136 domain-containing protein [Moraxellaceae bacterium]